MSFSSDVRMELSHIQVERACDARAELCAAVLTSSGMSFKGKGRYGLSFQSESRDVIERFMAMLTKYLGTRSEISIRHTDRLGGQTFYVLTPSEETMPGILDALMLLDPKAPFGMRVAPAGELLQKDCCRRAFLRGAFLLGGTITAPMKAYHLEIASGAEALSRAIAAVLHSYELPARLAPRKGQFVVYLKDADRIADLLGLIGAHKALLELENVRVEKGIRNEVNRQVNCDQNNLDKTVAAGEKQVSIINTIDRLMGLSALPETLKEIAELRMMHPDASFSDLGAMATPEIGKSGVSARMRRLEAIAEELVNQ